MRANRQRAETEYRSAAPRRSRTGLLLLVLAIGAACGFYGPTERWIAALTMIAAVAFFGSLGTGILLMLIVLSGIFLDSQLPLLDTLFAVMDPLLSVTGWIALGSLVLFVIGALLSERTLPPR